MMTLKNGIVGVVATTSLVLAIGVFAQPDNDGPADHQAHAGSLTKSSEADDAYRDAAMTMQHEMALANSGDPDFDFATGMLAHHKGAVAMAKVELAHGEDPEMRALAKKIIAAQQAEIEQMEAWLKANPAPAD